MRIFKTKKRTYFISIGSIYGAFLNSSRKIPNYENYDIRSNIIIGKTRAKKHPLYNGDITFYIFLFFRFGVLINGES